MSASWHAWNIIPFVSVGPLRFGMSRNDVRQKLGDNYKTFKKTPAASTDTDAYIELALHLYYDGSDCLDFVEFTSRSPLPVDFDGIALLSDRYKDVVKDFASRGQRNTNHFSSIRMAATQR